MIDLLRQTVHGLLEKKFFESSISLYNYFSCSYPPLSLPPFLSLSLSLSLSLPVTFFLYLSHCPCLFLCRTFTLFPFSSSLILSLSLSLLSLHISVTLLLYLLLSVTPYPLLFLYALSSSLSPTSHSSPISFPLFISILRFSLVLLCPNLFHSVALPHFLAYPLSLFIAP